MGGRNFTLVERDANKHHTRSQTYVGRQLWVAHLCSSLHTGQESCKQKHADIDGATLQGPADQANGRRHGHASPSGQTIAEGPDNQRAKEAATLEQAVHGAGDGVGVSQTWALDGQIQVLVEIGLAQCGGNDGRAIAIGKGSQRNKEGDLVPRR